jgi:hypothetical protein
MARAPAKYGKFLLLKIPAEGLSTVSANVFSFNLEYLPKPETRLKPIQNRPSPVIANQVGKIKLKAMEGIIPNSFVGMAAITYP